MVDVFIKNTEVLIELYAYMALGISFCTSWQFICNLIAYGKLGSYLHEG